MRASSFPRPRESIFFLLFAVAACKPVEAPQPAALNAYRVAIKGVFQQVNGTRVPLDVVSACADAFGGQDLVPPAERGAHDCKYIVPHAEVEIDLEATALDRKGATLNDYAGSIAFRVVPGELSGSYPNRWTAVSQGVAKGTVKATHVYGAVRVWVEDAPPQMIVDGGAVVGSADELPPEVNQRTFATGASDTINFEDQTLQSLQVPDGFDNRSSPFVGEFVVVGKNPESGEKLLQTCAADPLRNGQQVLMVVTGIDPSGFFVSDITACRLPEATKDATGATQVRTPELPEPCEVIQGGNAVPIETSDAGADGGICQISRKSCKARSNCGSYLPSTFAHMFVYNYSFPDGLNTGDLLFTISGAVQEFTSTSQMTFPAWTVAEHVRELPTDQWNKWLDFVPPVEITGRTCGQDDAANPFLTDQSCGHNRRNLKMESLESGLVKLRNVRFPQVFKTCDMNADGTVPFFCESRGGDGNWSWQSCSFDAPEPPADTPERTCYQNCVMGMGEFANVICSERTSFTGFGQFVVEMNAPGPAWAGLDESLPSRVISVGLADAGVSAGPSRHWDPGVQVSIVCDTDVRIKTGVDLPVFSGDEPLLPARQIMRTVFGPDENNVFFRAETAGGMCWVAQNTQTRINLTTKDAIPELNPDCRIDDPDMEAAAQCRNLRGSTFDIVGHLRHVQPARPRWMVLPRDADDVCCRPGPGLQCPKPIKPCTSNF